MIKQFALASLYAFLIWFVTFELGITAGGYMHTIFSGEHYSPGWRDLIESARDAAIATLAMMTVAAIKIVT
ncbi:MAG: hypothetical protein ACRYG5_04250 [Janthinobacterium lividum]